MIASGLCVMGGCYAQGADAACVDAYWPAERACTPGGEVATLLTLPFSGGSSESDCVYFKGRIDFDEAPSPVVAWSNFMGIIASQPTSTTWNSDSCSVRTYQKYELNITYGSAKWNARAVRGMLVLSAYNSHISVTLDDVVLLASTCTPFVVPAVSHNNRYVILRNNVLREFCGAIYANEDTGVRFMLQAMQSPCGENAIWENYSSSLVEI